MRRLALLGLAILIGGMAVFPIRDMSPLEVVVTIAMAVLVGAVLGERSVLPSARAVARSGRPVPTGSPWVPVIVFVALMLSKFLPVNNIVLIALTFVMSATAVSLAYAGIRLR